MIDLFLNPNRNRLCSGVSRRDMLRVGGVGLFGVTLSGMLARQKALASEAATPRRPRAKNVIMIYLGGGMSHHDTFDPKPEQPEEIRGQYKTIPTSVPGIRITDRLPLTAKIVDKIAIVRGGVHGNDSHEIASNWVLSGRFGSPFGDYPAMGAVVAHQMGFSGKLPPYVAIPKNPSFSWELGKSAFLGGRCEAFRAGDPNEDGYKVKDLTLHSPLSPQAIDRRRSLLQAVNHLGAKIRDNDQMATYDEFQQRAADIVSSSDAQSAFDLNQEKTELRDAYGRTTFGQSCLLARRLVERDVRYVTVSYTGWDHHKKIFEGIPKRVPPFDMGFSTLITDMHQRGLLKDTLVMVLTDFGRSPKVNKDAGRDHWGHAGSMLFAGAGVQGGKVVGATDDQGAYVIDRPVHPSDVAFTLYSALGINPHTELQTPEGRPVAVLTEGGVIEELYA